LSEKDQIINQLTQELAKERKNSAEQKQVIGNLHQQLQTEQETNANLKQKLSQQEQNHANLINAYQITLKDKQAAEKQVNYYETQLKIIVKSIYQ